jgi:hypothetical protein
MKKIFYLLPIVLMTTLIACKNKTAEEENTGPATSTSATDNLLNSSQVPAP